MITKIERDNLKKILPRSYSKAVIEILKERKQYNSHGAQYTSQSIRNVMAGLEENKDIENAIFSYALRVQKRNDELAENRKRLLSQYKDSNI